jgi:hypothetical protein
MSIATRHFEMPPSTYCNRFFSKALRLFYVPFVDQTEARNDVAAQGDVESVAQRPGDSV